MTKRRKKNQILEKIFLERAGAKGIAIGKTLEGKTVLVKGGIPGDTVNVQVKRSKSNYYEGEAIDILSPSADRVIPRCIHFGVCGGCKWQNMSYDAQLRHKQEEVYNNILRIGGIKEEFKTLPILPAPEPYYYRNKMEFSFSNARWLTTEEIQSETNLTQRDALGFHIPGQWSKILDLKECHLQEDPSNQIRLFVREYALDNGLEFFDLKDQSGLLRTMMLRQNSKGEWMIVFQFFQNQAENIQKLMSELQKAFPQIKSLCYTINPKANDSIYDLDIHVWSGKGYLVEEMDGLKFKIGPKSFFQTNYHQALELYRKTLEFANIGPEDVVYDLYTGTGTIAQYMARKAKQVIGIEAVPEAIQAAIEHAQLNGLDNCTFYCGDMKDIFNTEFLNNHPKANILITDPPRDGMHTKVIEQILRLAPQRIVYVSCNSATQARDLDLLRTDYRLEKILPVDMFPQTHHVENIALLVRRP